MLLVTKKGSRVTWLRKVIAVITLHVHRVPAQVSARDETPHASRHVAELIIMSRSQLEPLVVGERDESPRLLLTECDWLLHIDVASSFQAKARNSEMALGRRRDVNNVRPGVTQKFSQSTIMPFNGEPFVQLPRHQRFAVTDSDDLAFLDP